MSKVLSLLQPWASLAVMGIKKIETRSWTSQYRGTLMIHASKGNAGRLIAENKAIRKYIPDYKALPFGMVIGEVTLTDIVRVEQLGLDSKTVDKLSLEENAFGEYSGRYAWLFENATSYDEPIPATGRMGLWEF